MQPRQSACLGSARRLPGLAPSWALVMRLGGATPPSEASSGVEEWSLLPLTPLLCPPRLWAASTADSAAPSVQIRAFLLAVGLAWLRLPRVNALNSLATCPCSPDSRLGCRCGMTSCKQAEPCLLCRGLCGEEGSAEHLLLSRLCSPAVLRRLQRICVTQAWA